MRILLIIMVFCLSYDLGFPQEKEVANKKRIVLWFKLKENFPESSKIEMFNLIKSHIDLERFSVLEYDTNIQKYLNKRLDSIIDSHGNLSEESLDIFKKLGIDYILGGEMGGEIGENSAQYYVLDINTRKYITECETYPLNDITAFSTHICKRWEIEKLNDRLSNPKSLYRAVWFAFIPSINSVEGLYHPLLKPNVTFNNIPIEDGGYIKPGIYHIVAKLKGYETFSKIYELEPISRPFTLMVQLKAKERLIQIKLKCSPENQPIIPDICKLNEINIFNQGTFKPGLYELYIAKKGYQSISEWITIPPDDTPFIIEKALENNKKD